MNGLTHARNWQKSTARVLEKHPDSQTPLARWFKLISIQKFRNFAELLTVFPSADQVGNLIVFNIGGNKYRLIVSIHFNRGRVYVRHILTHTDYNKGRWNR